MWYLSTSDPETCKCITLISSFLLNTHLESRGWKPERMSSACSWRVGCMWPCECSFVCPSIYLYNIYIYADTGCMGSIHPYIQCQHLLLLLSLKYIPENVLPVSVTCIWREYFYSFHELLTVEDIKQDFGTWLMLTLNMVQNLNYSLKFWLSINVLLDCCFQLKPTEWLNPKTPTLAHTYGCPWMLPVTGNTLPSISTILIMALVSGSCVLTSNWTFSCPWQSHKHPLAVSECPKEELGIPCTGYLSHSTFCPFLCSHPLWI